MSNAFGRVLQSQLEKHSIKQSQLADAISYDVTYISKWINGRKLPSSRNVEFIVSEISSFIESISQCDERNKVSKEELEELFIDAYKEDFACLERYSDLPKSMEFANGHKALLELTKSTLYDIANSINKKIYISATFDLFKHFGAEFARTIRGLGGYGIEEVKIKVSVDPSDIESNYQIYVLGILDVIGNIPNVDICLVERELDKPRMMIINDFLCVQILWYIDGDLTSIYSKEKATVERFILICDSILEDSKKLLNSADPMSLRRTNVQLDSYSDYRQWLFFNEAPSLFIPDSVLKDIMGKSKDEDYIKYLQRLGKIFETRTKNSEVKLLVYSSAINQYVSDGYIKIGNVGHTFNEEQVRAHLRYLSQIMKENDKFSIYMIRDTVLLSHELRNSPSIFVDTSGVYIEDSRNPIDDNFHLSMEPAIRNSFEKYFNNILEEPYCTKLTSDDLLRYI